MEIRFEIFIAHHEMQASEKLFNSFLIFLFFWLLDPSAILFLDSE